jgi:hypothetical protein
LRGHRAVRVPDVEAVQREQLGQGRIGTGQDVRRRRRTDEFSAP